jgi:apolipoprotein N-acyltransferase
VFRGIENGFSVVRAAERGLVSVSDPYGRMVSQSTRRTGSAVVTAAVGSSVSTAYPVTGVIFQFAVIGWLLISSVVGFARHRTGR